MTSCADDVASELTPTGGLRASINLGNPVLAQRGVDDPDDPPRGVTVSLAREAEVAFRSPYTVIEGVYVVPDDSEVRDPADVDLPGTRIGVKRGSAYDLYLTRTLRGAEVVRGEEGVHVISTERLEVGAGIRQPVTAWTMSHPGHRVVEPAFVQIRQAVAVPRDRSPAARAFVDAFVAEQVSSGRVDDALAGGRARRPR